MRIVRSPPRAECLASGVVEPFSHGTLHHLGLSQLFMCRSLCNDMKLLHLGENQPYLQMMNMTRKIHVCVYVCMSV